MMVREHTLTRGGAHLSPTGEHRASRLVGKGETLFGLRTLSGGLGVSGEFQEAQSSRPHLCQRASHPSQPTGKRRGPRQAFHHIVNQWLLYPFLGVEDVF